MTTLQMYTDRAAECRREADAATLVNVRDRCLSSALAWESLVHRAELTETFRANDAERKAERGRVQTRRR